MAEGASCKRALVKTSPISLGDDQRCGRDFKTVVSEEAIFSVFAYFICNEILFAYLIPINDDKFRFFSLSP